MSVRLHVIVEGQTEETFVRDVLTLPLALGGVYVDVHAVTTSRRRGRLFRGGGCQYEHWKRDLSRWTRQDRSSDARFTTMLDLYGISRFTDGFPGLQESGATNDPYERVAYLERSFGADVNDHRFIPYIQLHEFESLIFAEPAKLELEFIEHRTAISRLSNIAREVNPELIDEGDQTAPSKRIIAEIPAYKGRKASAGPLVTAKIGISVLRQRCKHFDEWLSRLEQLAVA